MKHCSLLCKGWWPLLILPLLFMVPLLFFSWGAIETDVANNTNQALSAKNLEWANVETVNRGRHVLITGTPPNTESVELAERVARSSYGVDEVTISTDVIPPAAPAKLNTSISDGKIILIGQLASQEEIDKTITQAAASFGADNIENRLEIGDNTAKLPELNGFFRILQGNADGAKDLTANISGDNLLLTGEVVDSSIKQGLANSIDRLFKGRIDNQLNIAAPPPRNVCQDLVNEILSAGTINFETGKAKIKQDSFALLEKLKLTAEGCPDAKFEVAGHTDASGKLSFNMTLSQQRAQSVIDHLVGLGLSTTQFSANGYGPNKPIADNATDEGRAQNRRIEFKLKN